jgi:Uma2 family endonuclease
MSKTLTKIGPEDQGRRMSLDEFDQAEGREGYLYELSRGVVTVTDVPAPRHLAQVSALKRQIHAYDLAHPGRIHTIASGSECKILLAGLESERHPDLTIYKTPPPEGDEDVWSSWIPEIVIEVVSPSSRHCDYEEKPEEYLQFGVLEYWIVDSKNREMVVLHRSRGRWNQRVVQPPKTFRTRILPGFVLDLGLVFPDAAD